MSPEPLGHYRLKGEDGGTVISLPGPFPGDTKTGHRAGELRLVPVRFADACGFVKMWHRHHQPPIGHKFCVGVADEESMLLGVVIVGRPVARAFDDGLTLEVTRSATDGTANVNSMLYAVCMACHIRPRLPALGDLYAGRGVWLKSPGGRLASSG